MVRDDEKTLIIDKSYIIQRILGNKLAEECASVPSLKLEGKICYKIFFNLDSPCPNCPAKKAIQSNSRAESTIAMQSPSISRKANATPIHSSDSEATELAVNCLDNIPLFIQASRKTDNSSLSQTFSSPEAPRQNEALSIEAEKFEAMGRLVGKIVHDINNHLMVILNHLDLMRRKISSNGDETFECGEKDIDFLVKQANGISTFLDEMCFFQDDSQIEMAPANLNEILTNAITVAKIQFSRRAKNIDFVSTDKLPDIKCSESKLQYAFLQVILNALEAIDDHGHVRVTLKYNNENNGYFLITVRDTGPGIPAEEISKVIEPFYTTSKGKDKSGLGLSIAYSTVLNHNGTLQIKSETAGGTIVRIQLPRA
ncbi:MAG: HAMP domain-containing histidine kinase [Calditrichaeota bacterium]|nr:HAMP domain-containing histidine kinase [Calditrichota bacterium]